MGFRKNCIIKSKTNFKKILIYKVQVQFSKDFLKIEKDQVSMGIKSKPIKGEANKEIIKKLKSILQYLQQQYKSNQAINLKKKS